MITRWMKLEGTTFCTHFLLSVFRINKAKILLSVCFLNCPCIKNSLKIKVLQMPCKFSMIFSGIFEDFRHWKHCRRGKHQNAREEGASPCRACPPVSWAPGDSPPLMPAPTHFIFYPKKSPSSSSTSSSLFCCNFRSPSSKLHSQNCFGRLLLGMWLLHWSN